MRKSMLGLVVLFAAIVVASASAANFIGTNGNDVKNGTQFNDYFDLKPGDDYAFAKAGTDEIHLGDGVDVGYGAQNGDRIIGGDGFDRLYAGCNGVCPAGADNLLYGGNGNDQLAADNGERDLVDGGPGTDTCFIDWNDSDTSCEIRHIDGNFASAEYGSGGLDACYTDVKGVWKSCRTDVERPTVSTDSP